MKRFLSLFLLLPLLLTLASCQKEGEPSDTTAAPPSRVAVLFSSLAEAWLDAGGQIAITVGETVERGLAPEGTPLVDAGAGKSIDTERLLSLRPDLVILSSDIPAQVAAGELCRAAGIPTLSLRIETFEDYCRAIEAMTALTGSAGQKAELSALMTEVEELLSSQKTEKLRGTRILFVRSGQSSSSTKAKGSNDHFAAAMLRELGCINIADETPHLLDTLSAEAILAADPDVIFFSLMGDAAGARAHVDSLLLRPEWQALSAVREGRVILLPRELFHYKPCGRWAEAYRTLITLLTEGADE